MTTTTSTPTPGASAHRGSGSRPGADGAVRRPGVAATLALLVTTAAVGALAVVDLTLGSADVGAGDLLAAVLGRGGEADVAVLVASRLPRVLAALLVGVALGAAGAVLQSVARNPLASPDTLAVNAGGYVAVVAVAAVGLTLPLALRGSVAFVGGLGAAALVLALSRAGASGPTRLVLAGSAVALALDSAATVMLLLYAQETTGLFAWGAGNVAQSGTGTVARVAPVVVVALAAAMLLGRRLDLLALGDDAASVLGVDVRRVRVVSVLVAVVLSAAAVTVAGPVGFVGLGAPVVARLLARRVPGLSRHVLLVPFAGLVGCVVVLAADVLLRTLLPEAARVTVPTGVVTTVFGASVLVWAARRLRDDVSRTTAAAGARPRTPRRAALTVAVLAAAVVAAGVAGLLLGDRLLLTGDVANWLRDSAGQAVTFVLDQRSPRVVAALLAGAALGLAGALVQTLVRNPLADPGLLGITGGAGIGAVVTIALVPSAGVWAVTGSAAVGAVVAFGTLLALCGRSRGADRLVLMGVGLNAVTAGLITVIVVVTSPWNTTMALTWLSGSTYGRTLEQSAPVAVALLVALPLAWAAHRRLDLVAIDEDTPRVLGVRVGAERNRALVLAALLAATAVSAVGVVGFVGLVAPHVARRLVGAAHRWSLPAAALTGALLVSVADTIGRTVIAPAQLPVGLVTALVGAPYFVWLLSRTARGSRV
ncbi:iron ABC transporter permease [Actinotalea sp. AC32]|nr:iron ABC transporter permease [Actinotalea sp. AC32]